jgi:hypothetical protein
METRVRHRVRPTPPAAAPAPEPVSSIRLTAPSGIPIYEPAPSAGPFLPDEEHPGYLGRACQTVAGYDTYRWGGKSAGYTSLGMHPSFTSAMDAIVAKGSARKHARA